MDIVWKALHRSLTKLIIDISRPIEVDRYSSLRKKHMSQDGMKSLIGLTKLRELRIFGMRNTFQSITWEAVFRNKADENEMLVLDLQMAETPIVRQKHWGKPKEIQGLKVSNKDGDTYKYA